MFGNVDLAVFYLARRAEGVKAFERFVRSYEAHPSGQDHQLVVIYKGFENNRDLRAARKAFSGVRHKSVLISDEPYDIGAYLHAAKRIDSTYVCFVNTHTEILADNWLAHLRNAMRNPEIGMAGATASFESLYDSMALTVKMVWIAGHNYLYHTSELVQSYKFTLGGDTANWLAAGLKKTGPMPLARLHNYRAIEEAWQTKWRLLLSDGQSYNFLRGFPRFPNPHVRSNGFIIDRKLLLGFFSDLPHTKEAAYAFESGPLSLSARVVGKGLKLALVTRQGEVVFQDKWVDSKTFRLGDQSNLLMADNQTRGFDTASQAERRTFTMMSWGETACKPSGGYPLGLVFDVTAKPRFGAGESSESSHVIDHAYYGTHFKRRPEDVPPAP